MHEKEINIINSIKILGLDMINKANSGHPGIVLSAAPIIYTLFAKHLNFVPNAPNWLNRDRFVMSAGHGSALLYSTLFLSGYDISLQELQNFRQIDSQTPGHPELGITPGVDMTTGPLGQGIASAVGIAIGERYLRSLASEIEDKQKVVDYYTYVLVGDGDLMEGVSYEACSFAGTQKLDKLIVLYDSNNISLDGSTNLTFTEDVLKRFDAMGWHTQVIKNGESIKDIDKAITKAKAIKDKPSIIEIKTVIGKGTSLEGTNTVHGNPIGEEELRSLRTMFKLSPISFDVSKDALVDMRTIVNNRMSKIYGSWANEYNKFAASNNDKIKSLLKVMMTGEVQFDFTSDKFAVNNDYKDEFRNTNAKVLNMLADKSPYFIGGTADVATSTKAVIEKTGVMSSNTPLGRNIYFGVREHAMAAIMNGIVTTGLRCFSSGFLAFSNYSMPAIRQSALMNLPVTYIFTHDSIANGEDGPTHQPVEQLTQLRAIPNLTVLRPADVSEVIGSWATIVKEKKPTTIIISKGMNAKINGTDANQVKNGGYIVKQELGQLAGTIISTGSELKYALLISNYLDTKNIFTRVVSIPSLELYLAQGKDYQDSIVPPNIRTIVIEYGLQSLWIRLATDARHILGVRDFGYSGKKDDVLKKYDLDYESLKNRVENLFL